MTSDRPWAVVLTGPAQRDFDEILRWTTATFGAQQARVYAATLSATLEDLRAGPDLPLARSFQRARLLHVRRRGRAGRHLIVFRPLEADRRVIVLRILHGSMDLEQHIADDDPSS